MWRTSVVDHGDLHALPFDRHAHGHVVGADRVAQCVGETLLEDPVGRQIHRGRQPVEDALAVHAYGHPGRADGVGQLVKAAERRPRLPAPVRFRVPAVIGPERMQQEAQFRERRAASVSMGGPGQIYPVRVVGEEAPDAAARS